MHLIIIIIEGVLNQTLQYSIISLMQVHFSVNQLIAAIITVSTRVNTCGFGRHKWLGHGTWVQFETWVVFIQMSSRYLSSKPGRVLFKAIRYALYIHCNY